MTYPPQGPYGQQPDPYGQQQPDQYGQYGGGYPQQQPPPTGQFGAYDPNAQYGGGGYPQYGGLGGPPPKKNKGPIIAVVAIVVILLAGLGITGFVAPGFFLSGDKKDTADPGGGGGGGGDKGASPDDFIDKLVAAADDRDKSALRDMKCSDADDVVDSAIDAIDDTSAAKLKDTREESDDEVTVVLSITHDSEDDDYAATVVRDGKDWCWQSFGKGTKKPTGEDPGTSSSEEEPSASSDSPAASTEPGGGGSTGDSDGEQFVQTFLDKLNGGDGAGAVALVCKDSTSQTDITDAATKGAALEVDPAGTTADSSYVGADLKGTVGGADVSSRVSAFLEDEGWCVYTFYAY
jgi:hypothetical protein